MGRAALHDSDMGLAKPALRFILREHKQQPITGPLLQLGRQTLGVEPAEFPSLFREEGLTPAALPSRAPLATPDVEFFNRLGIGEVQALDFSAYEGADIIHDLNHPVPDSLAGRFNFILDGGTSEHIFDIRRAMQNIVAMLKPGGRVLHMQPMNNYVNHGFYQFSPTFYYDFYAANGFADLRGYLYEHGARRPFGGRLYELNPRIRQNQIASGNPMRSMAIFFLARKPTGATGNVIPAQAHYASLIDPARDNPRVKTGGSGLQKKINRTLPRPVVRVLQRGMTALNLESPGQTPFFDPTRHRGHPWGLKYLGRLD